MHDPSHVHGSSPEPGGRRLQHLGDAHNLLDPYILESTILLRGKLPYESPADRIPCSVLTRDPETQTLQVTVNIPGAILGDAAWGAVGRERELGPIFRATAEILEDLSRMGQAFMEINFIPANCEPHLSMSLFDYRMEVRATDESRPHMGYLSVSFEFLESEKEQAAQRAGDAIDNIVGFCCLHGMQRTIQRIVDAQAGQKDPLGLQSVELPLPDEVSELAVFSRLLPDEATDRAFKSGGHLGGGKPFIEFKAGRVHLRIPCGSATASKWSYYLNEGELAGRFGINSSYIELHGPNSPIAGLVEKLANRWAAFPDEEPSTPSNRKEPGYWHLHALIDQKDPYSSLQAMLQFVTTFREVLLHGRAFWSKQDPENG